MKFFFRFALPLIVASFVAKVTKAQTAFQPVGQDAYHWIDRFEIKSGRFLKNIHTSVKPFLRSDIANEIKLLDTTKAARWSKVDSLNMKWLSVDNHDLTRDTAAKNKKPILYTFFRYKPHLFYYDDGDFMVSVNPVLDVGAGYQNNSVTGLKFVNTRGIELRGWISKKLGFYFYAAESQMRPPDYVHGYITKYGEVPYAGYYKAFKTNGYDYFNARGYITFKAIKPITLTFGADRNIIGHGERSLFMSDFSNEYLFLKIQTKVWKLNYTNIFAEGIENYDHFKGDQLLPKRYAAFHHLSLNLTRWMNIGLFEGVIFNRNKGFDLHYINPLIFYRSTEQYLGSPDNALMGIDGKINFLRSVSLYGQFILDDLNISELRKNQGYWGNKFGGLAGAKYIDAFTVKNLDLQAEISFVKPYTYTHSDTGGSYTNYNLPWAHPLGANFAEAVGVLRFQPIQDLTITGKLFFDVYGIDSTGQNWGSHIKKVSIVPTIMQVYGNKIGQGIGVQQAMATGAVQYEIIHNLFVEAYAMMRVEKRENEVTRRTTQYAQLSLRWNIPPRRFEF